MDDYIPRNTFEAEQTRHEARERRKDIIIIVLVVMFLLNNIAWLLFFNQFDFHTETVMFDTTDGGDNSYIGNDGVINNGENGSTEDGNDAQETAP